MQLSESDGAGRHQALASRDRDQDEGMTPAAARAEQAKQWCFVAIGVAMLMELAEALLELDGLLWDVLGGSVAVAFAATLVAWMAFAFRAAGGLRAWLVPALTAIAAVAALTLLAGLFD